MKSNTLLKIVISIFLMPLMLGAQTEILGEVIDESGEPVIGALVTDQVSGRTKTTDINGYFSMMLQTPTKLLVTHPIYKSKEQGVNKNSVEVIIELSPKTGTSAIVTSGDPLFPRSVKDSPVPIDNIPVNVLGNSGRFQVDKALSQQVPSFNSNHHAISDATAFFDPADLRGLGPGRTLVLINGKRKNPSSLLYLSDTPGKGDAGIDFRSIPLSAISRIEVLRDGASVQYGSDAIAGVIDITLDNSAYTKGNAYTGLTSKGDGLAYGFDFNIGKRFGKANEGMIHLTSSFSKQEETNRAGRPGQDLFFHQLGIIELGDEWTEENPDLRMKIGLPNMTTMNLIYNASYEVLDSTTLYGFGGITFRNGSTYALYRPPYWVPDPYNIFHENSESYNGFHPSFESNIEDKFSTVGLRGTTNFWRYDISFTSGSHSTDFNVGESLNVSLGASSPTNFRAGEYEYRTNTGDLTLGRKFGNVTFQLGGEFRAENFKVIAGEEASYVGSGVVSFPGLRPENEVDKSRYNLGGFVNLRFEPESKKYLIGGAFRSESYSDFGSNFSWKVNGRLNLNEAVRLRSSVSTGFRAPLLHQSYLSNTQTLIADGSVSDQATINQDNPLIRALGVEPLKDEKSLNLSVGCIFDLTDNLSFYLDGYYIKLKDRVVFSAEVTADTLTVGSIINSFGYSSIKFFTNALDTRTIGLDAVLNYKRKFNLDHFFDIKLSANFNKHAIIGGPQAPDLFEENGVSIFNRKEEARITSGRPQSKAIASFDYQKGRFGYGFNIVRYGKVTWQHSTEAQNDQTFSPRIVCDANLKYCFDGGIVLKFIVNNIFDTYPDPIDAKGDYLTNLGGRFYYPWETSQFDLLGRNYYVNLNYTF